MNTVTRRAATEEDDSFLYELFNAVRRPEFAHVPMPPEALDTLMRMQYDGAEADLRLAIPRRT